MDPELGAARSEDPDAVQPPVRATRNATHSPFPPLSLDEDRPPSKDPDRDWDERAGGGERAEAHERGSVVPGVAGRCGEHLDPIEERQKAEPEREDRDHGEEDHATDEHHPRIVARSEGQSP